MQPMQFSSLAVYMANQPRRFGVVRQANTSTGHTARQKPHALHMSSETTTSQRPAGPREGFFSVLNSGIWNQATENTTGSVRVKSKLSGRRRLDDLEDELAEVLLLTDGSGRQPLCDLPAENENQA